MLVLDGHTYASINVLIGHTYVIKKFKKLYVVAVDILYLAKIVGLLSE